MYRVFEHSQVILSVFQCMYAIYEASLQSHELYCDDPNPQLLSCQPNKLRSRRTRRRTLSRGIREIVKFLE